jgi:hypothetical protein
MAPRSKKISWCSECGEGVRVDSDGCCGTCGGSALGEGAERACRLADLARKLLAVERTLYVPGPGDDFGEVALDSADWDALVKLAQEAGGACCGRRGSGCQATTDGVAPCQARSAPSFAPSSAWRRANE